MDHHPKSAHIGNDTDYAGGAVPYDLVERSPVHSSRIHKVTVVLPLHNEEQNIKSVCVELIESLKIAGYRPSIVLVDDGSTDRSLAAAMDLAASHEEISYISFSRNFGKEAALMAGMIEADDDFDALAYMDSDGQHDPVDLVKMLRAAEHAGVDLVCGARIDRSYQSGAQRWLTNRFYSLFHALTDHTIEKGVGDFNVLRPNVVNALRSLSEEHLFMKGLIAWVGFERKIVPIKIRPRSGGEAKSSTRKMMKLATGAFLSFSGWPLRVWSVVGFSSSAFALVYLGYVILDTVLTGTDVPGYATTVVLLLGLGGLQLFSIGILGEYVARIYDASKKRPRYIISQRSLERI